MLWNSKYTTIHIGNLSEKSDKVVGMTVNLHFFDRHKHTSVVGVSLSVKRRGDQYCKNIGRQLAAEYSAHLGLVFPSSPLEEGDQPLIRIGVPLRIPNSLMSDIAVQGYVLSLIKSAIELVGRGIHPDTLFQQGEMQPRHDTNLVADYNLYNLSSYMIGRGAHFIRFNDKELYDQGGILSTIDAKIEQIASSISRDPLYPTNNLSLLICRPNSFDMVRELEVLCLEQHGVKKAIKKVNQTLVAWSEVQALAELSESL